MPTPPAEAEWFPPQKTMKHIFSGGSTPSEVIVAVAQAQTPEGLEMQLNWGDAENDGRSCQSGGRLTPARVGRFLLRLGERDGAAVLNCRIAPSDLPVITRRLNELGSQRGNCFLSSILDHLSIEEI